MSIPSNGPTRNLQVKALVWTLASAVFTASAVSGQEKPYAAVRLVKDLTPGTTNNQPNSSNPRHFFSHGNLLYFTAYSSEYRKSLVWKTDGTEEGTELVGLSEMQTDPIEINGKYVYRGFDSQTRWEPYFYDPAEHFGGMLADTNTASQESYGPREFIRVGDLVYFTAALGSGNSRYLWYTDGTPEGTGRLVAVSNYGLGFVNPTNLTESNGILYFSARVEGSVSGGTGPGIELLRTEGTYETTTVVKDINTGPGTGRQNADSNARPLATFEDLLFFEANDGNDGSAMWVTDGTEANTTRIGDFSPSNEFTSGLLWTVKGEIDSGFLGIAAEIDAGLVFATSDNSTGYSLRITDGTTNGTTELVSGSLTSIDFIVSKGSFAFVVMGNQSSGRELWVTDGTIQGTIQLTDLRGASDGVPPVNMYESIKLIDGNLWFPAIDEETGHEPWCSDGTLAGTQILKDVLPGNYPGSESPAGSLPRFFHPVGEQVFFQVLDSHSDPDPLGRELFVARLGGLELDLYDGIDTSSPLLRNDSGASVDFGPTLTATPITRSFTLHNYGGTDPVSIESITVPGEFTVLNSPIAALPPGASHTFQVRYDAPVGSHTGLLSIASQHPDDPNFTFTYEIEIAARAYDEGADSDNDGLDDYPEALMSQLGFDPAVANPELVAAYEAAAPHAGYLTEADLGVITGGAPLIGMDPSTGNFTITLRLKQSSDLVNYTDLPFSSGTTSLAPDGALEFTFPPQGTNTFFYLDAE